MSRLCQVEVGKDAPPGNWSLRCLPMSSILRIPSFLIRERHFHE